MPVLNSSCRKHQYAKIACPKALVLLAVWAGALFSVFLSASTISAQETPAQPELGAVVPMQTGHARKPTLQELYAMFFTYAVHIENASAAAEKLGEDKTFYKLHLQTAAGLTVDEYREVLASAKRYLDEDANTQQQLSALYDSERPERSLSSSAVALPRQYITQAKALETESTSALDAEIAHLRQILGQQRADALDRYLQTVYAVKNMGPTQSTDTGPSTSRQVPETLPSKNTSGSIEGTLEALQLRSIATPESITFNGGLTCYDFYDNYADLMTICIDSQMSYWGPSNQVELYTAGTSSTGQYSSSLYYGSLSINGRPANILCYQPAGVGNTSEIVSGCTASLSLPGGVIVNDPVAIIGNFNYGNGATYTWTSSVTDYLIGGGSAWHADPNPPSVTINYPIIGDLSDTTFYAGELGSFSISNGQYMVSPFGNQPTVSDSRGDFSMLVAPNATNPANISVNYTVSNNPPTLGSDSISVNNGFGQSGASFITITPAPPVITSATVVGSSTNSLQAGPTGQTVTLTGTNFMISGGSQPTISVSSCLTISQQTQQNTCVPDSSVSIGGITASSPTSVSFTVAVASDTSAGSVVFELTANDGAQSPSTQSAAVTINPMAPPAATITFNGANITDTGTSSPTQVVAGQQIYLSISLDDGSDPSTIATSIDWTVPGTSIGGFTAFTNANTGQIIPVQTEQPAVLFYWIYPGSSPTQPFTVDYTYCVDVNMQSCATASATFNVAGPTGVNMTATPGPAELFLEQNGGYNGAAALSFGDINNTPGMTFDAQMSAPGDDNRAFFVQLINYDNSVDLLASGDSKTCNGPANAPALDSGFPYRNFNGSLSTSDSPEEPLGDPAAPTVPYSMEGNRVFSATMYLMWLPANSIPPSPPANFNFELSIPVPLGSITWTYGGDAINTLQLQNTTNGGTTTLNDTTYVLNHCSGCTSASMQFIPSSSSQPHLGYPTWTAPSITCSGAGSTEARGGRH